jgi:hypothetical protein
VQEEFGKKVTRTLLNAVLMGKLLVRRLSFMGTGDSLNTLVEVVLDWRTAFGLLALY